MKVITVVVNNPIFIELQFLTLKKFLLTPYEFIVFNDAKAYPDYTNNNDITMKKQIENICNKLDIKCINIDNDYQMNNTSSSYRHSQSMNEMLKFQLNNPDLYLILDSDMFLIDYLDINKYINFNAAIVLQQRVNKSINYIWPGLCFFNMNNINNFKELKWDMIPNTDNGGASYIWLNNQVTDNEVFPSVEVLRHYHIETSNIYFISHLWSLTWNQSEYPFNNNLLLDFLNNDFRNINNMFYCEIYDNCFLHYRAGSNWNNEDINLHDSQILKFKDVILSLI
jgi:hypothetical protein